MGRWAAGIKYSEAVEAHVVASPIAALALVVAGLATLGMMAPVPMAPWVRLVVSAALFVGVCDAVRVTFLRLAPRGVRAFRIERSGAVRVWDGSGRRRKGRLRPGGFVAAQLTIVRWRPDGARFDRTFLLLPGMVDGQSLRRLRVLLRWG